jgi:superoxide dismutase, Cu-Zn family
MGNLTGMLSNSNQAGASEAIRSRDNHKLNPRRFMKKLSAILFSLSVPLALFNAGCQATHEHMHGSADAHGAAWAAVKQAVAVIQPTAGNQCKGTVRFTQMDGQVKVVADLSGLTPNQKHAIHIHQFGDISAPDGTSAGGHYNPEGFPHGLPPAPMRHAGDLGNLQADAAGNAHDELTVDNISIAGMKNPIIGRAIVVHAKPDDGGQPTGNAGGRIGDGVIGIAKSAP